MDSLPELTYDSIGEPHTCIFCQDIVIDIPDAYTNWSDCDFSALLPYTAAQIAKAALSGCPCFMWDEDVALSNKQYCTDMSKSQAQCSTLHFSSDFVSCGPL